MAQSLSPLLVQQDAIDKWDGKLPTYSGGGALPFINIGKWPGTACREITPEAVHEGRAYTLPFLYIKVWIAFARGREMLHANIYVF